MLREESKQSPGGKEIDLVPALAFMREAICSCFTLLTYKRRILIAPVLEDFVKL